MNNLFFLLILIFGLFVGRVSFAGPGDVVNGYTSRRAKAVELFNALKAFADLQGEDGGGEFYNCVLSVQIVKEFKGCSEFEDQCSTVVRVYAKDKREMDFDGMKSSSNEITLSFEFSDKELSEKVESNSSKLHFFNEYQIDDTVYGSSIYIEKDLEGFPIKLQFSKGKFDPIEWRQRVFCQREF